MKYIDFFYLKVFALLLGPVELLEQLLVRDPLLFVLLVDLLLLPLLALQLLSCKKIKHFSGFS